MKVTILGEGAWGTALATMCAQAAHHVTIWCYSAECAQEITTHHTNKQYMPGIVLDERIDAVTHLEQAIEQADCVIIALPVRYIRSVLEQAPTFFPKQLVVVTSKGIEQTTGKLPTQLCQEILKTNRLAVVSGPSFAYDLVRAQLTGMTFATTYPEDGAVVKKIFNVNYLTLQHSADLPGLQVCGAFKNIIAIAVGLLDGLGYGDNTKILLIMRMLDELKVVLNYYGADSATVTTFAGIGDSMLTCLGSKSKNRSAGVLFAQGQSLDQLEQIYGTLPEGFNTLLALQSLGEHQDTLKITQALYRIIYQNADISQLVYLLQATI